MAKGEFQRKAWNVLSFSIAWSIWLTRNNMIFKEIQPDWEAFFTLTLHRL
jgi:hypothetical protein